MDNEELAFNRGVMLTKLNEIEREVREQKDEIRTLRSCFTKQFKEESQERRKLELSLKKLLWSLGAAFFVVQAIPLVQDILRRLAQ